MAERKPSTPIGATLDPSHELPAAVQPTELPKRPAEPPALIAGRDLEHYWNLTKWPVLATVVLQAVAFLTNRPLSWEWALVAVLAGFLGVRVRRNGGDAQYLLAVTGIGGAFTGIGTALVHVVLGRQLFYIVEFIRLPFETAIVTMLIGTLPFVLLDRWRARRSRVAAHPISEPTPNDGPDLQP